MSDFFLSSQTYLGGGRNLALIPPKFWWPRFLVFLAAEDLLAKHFGLSEGLA